MGRSLSSLRAGRSSTRNRLPRTRMIRRDLEYQRAANTLDRQLRGLEFAVPIEHATGRRAVPAPRPSDRSHELEWHPNRSCALHLRMFADAVAETCSVPTPTQSRANRRPPSPLRAGPFDSSPALSSPLQVSCGACEDCAAADGPSKKSFLGRESVAKAGLLCRSKKCSALPAVTPREVRKKARQALWSARREARAARLGALLAHVGPDRSLSQTVACATHKEMAKRRPSCVRFISSC